MLTCVQITMEPNLSSYLYTFFLISFVKTMNLKLIERENVV